MPKKFVGFFSLYLVLFTFLNGQNLESFFENTLLNQFAPQNQYLDDLKEDAFMSNYHYTALKPYIYENFGQNDDRVKYICHIPYQGHFLFTGDMVVYRNSEHWISFKVAASQMNDLIVNEEVKSKTHFFHAKLQKSNLKNYQRLEYRNILDGIDLEFTMGKNSVVKSSFYLKKGTDLNLVQLNYEIDNDLDMLIDEDGSLLFQNKKTQRPILRESKPIFFQNGKELIGEYKLDQDKKQISFEITDPSFQPSLQLIIDPNYATYIAGSDIDVSMYGTTDSNHCGIISGYTESSDFPIKNPIQSSIKGSQDAFIVKTCDGKSLEWSTYLGSTGDDMISFFVVDSDDSIYATGSAGNSESASTDSFPTTSGAYMESCSTSSDTTIVFKLRSDGSELLWSTFLCADSDNKGMGITLTDTHLVIGGETLSELPPEGESGGSYCDSGDVDGSSFYAAKLLIDGTGPLASSICISGSSTEYVTRANGNSERLIFVGHSISTNLPTTSGVLMEDSPTGGGDFTWFMGSLSTDDLSVNWLGYFGGSSGVSYPLAIAFKSTGEIWISGKTHSTDFPVSDDAEQDINPGTGHYVGTFTLFSSDGAEMLYSSYLGGFSKGDSDIWTIGVGANDEVVIGMSNPTYPDDDYDYDFGVGAGVIVWNSDVSEHFRKIRVGTFRVMGIGFYQNDIFNFTIVGSSTSVEGYISILETTDGAFQEAQIDSNDLFAIHIYTKCDVGYYGVDQGCQPCAKGFYTDEQGTTKECSKCPKGTFSNETASSQCNDCPRGWYNSYYNSTTCYKCDRGKYANETQTVNCKICEAGTYNTEEGSTSCEQCGLGTFNQESGMSTCGKCDVGTFANQTGMSECYDCVAGTYNNLEGQDQCFECDMGKYQDSQKSTSCLSCLPVTFQDQSGQSHCKNCTGGTYNTKYSASRCEECGIGTFNPGDGSTKCYNCDYGHFGNQTGMEECYKCTAGSYSIDKGSTICELCGYGTYSDVAGMTSSTCDKCPMGTYNPSKGADSVDGVPLTRTPALSRLTAASRALGGTIANGIMATTCLDCPVGQEPDESQNVCQDCQAGFYSDTEGQVCEACAAGEFNNEQGLTYCVKCSSVEICLGNNTCDGERDPDYYCAKCKTGYFLLNDECQSCPQPVQAFLIISALALSLILIYVFRDKINNLMKSTRNPIKDIAFTFFQILAGIIALDLAWPVPVRTNLRFVSSAFNLEFDTVVSPECYENFTYYDTWLIIFLVPICGTILAVVFWCYYLKRYKQEPERLERRKIRLVHHYSIVLKYLYLPLVKLSIDPFDFTYQEEDGKYYLDSNPKLSPSDEKWQRFLPLFITSYVLYVIGIPIFFFIVVYKAKKANFSEWYEKRFGWMYRYFKPNRYWWELVEIFFKFLVIVTAVMFTVNSTGQAWFVLVLLAVLMILILILRPYKGEYPRYVAEDRLVVGLLLIAFSIVTLAIDLFNSVLFFILFPVGCIIAFDGIKENLRKFLIESKLIRAQIQMQAVELKNNNINLDDFLAKEGEGEKKSQKKNKQLLKQINEMAKGICTMKTTIKRTQKKITILTQENENFEEKNKIFWDENEQLEKKVKEKIGENDTSNTGRSDDIDN
ncbi:insulin-like growth factor binding protein [Anaeramoeba flamelloides]|uniref:Insulin-like growth factor binding protein n=1 Tax=Anaeramoeba flamelloides TaxID=1746091 RepID=A0ABQ8YY19_9EUKA|nr:insulin-like growth factor binding protein [Anaeramoeba flamelloides]